MWSSIQLRNTRNRGEANREIFATKNEQKESIKYHVGLKNTLASNHDIYIFFDSAGQVIYVGKARSQNLWKEINPSLNRGRDTAQKIKRVKYPGRTKEYRPINEITWQICSESVPLYEIASYFSAYQVTDGLVNILKSLLVRSLSMIY